MKRIVLLISILAFLTSCSEKEVNILVIGDSISQGYTPHLKSALEDRAVVAHNKGNARHTGVGIDNLDQWLSDTIVWDIIVFNWGLHDLCYRHPDSKLYGNRDKVNGSITHSPDEYQENLDILAGMLKETGARLLFISTTYIPPEEGGRFEGDDIVYNERAKAVMDKHGIEYLDINSLSKEIHETEGRGIDDVHFTEEGYRQLSQPITERLAEII
jgi:lysophospholipase L1-like esterase